MNKYNNQKQKMYLEEYNSTYILGLSSLIVYTGIKSFDIYDAYKNHNPKHIKPTPETKRKYNHINTKRIEDIRFSEAIKQFSYKMLENFPKENLTNLYNNINTIKISNIKSKIIRSIENRTHIGTYEAMDNKITILTDEYLPVINHELLHMSSSIYKDEITYSGFYQESDNINIGKGINEGYTELLNCRYFSQNKNHYSIEKHIVSILEQIVGKEKMENLYFNANLKGLIKELEKYSSTKEIIKFIENTDYMSENINKKILSPIQKKILNQKKEHTINFLLKTYFNKLLINNETPTTKEINSILCTFKRKEKLIFIISKKDIEKYKNEILEEKNKNKTRKRSINN